MCCLIIVTLDVIASKPKHKKKTSQQRNRKCCGFECSFYKYLSLNMLLIAVIYACYDPVIDSFCTIGQLLFVKKFKLSTNVASFANGLLPGINIILLPLTGLFVDVVGYHVFWSLLGILLALVTHFMLCSVLSHYIPFIAQVIYSISDSLFASSMSPLPAYIVPESQEGTIYGIMDSLENLMFVVCVFLYWLHS